MPDHPNALPVFTKATRKRVLLRMAISGPSGSGKTYTALGIGQGIAQATGLRLAVLDTENGSAEKYADLFDFDHLVMSHYAARNYMAGIAAAQDGQHSVLVIDSLSHAWSGIGGTLDTVDRYATGHRGDSFGGWREARPEQRELVDAMLKAKLHVIVTMRSKQAYEIEKVDGRNQVRKLGLKPEQTDGIEYEFDVAGDIDTDHRLTITKTRAPALNGRVYFPPGPDLTGELLEWIKPKPGDAEPTSGSAPSSEARNQDVAPATAPDTYEPDGHEPAAGPLGTAEGQFPGPRPLADDDGQRPADEPQQAQAAATGAPDTRVASAAQIGRAWKLGKGNPIVSTFDVEGTPTVSDTAMHELVAYLTRHDPGGPVASMKLLTRRQIDNLFTCLEQTKADSALAGRTAAAVQQWIGEQDDVAAAIAGAS